MTEDSMEPEVQARPEDGGTSGFRRLVRALFSLLLAAFLGLLLGAGLYWGAPALFRAFMEPVEANTARIDELAAEVRALDADQQEVEEQLADELALLQGQDVARGERLAELSNQLDRLEERLEEAETRLGAQGEQLEQLPAIEAELSRLEADLDRLEREQDDPDRIAGAGEVQQVRIMGLIARARTEILAENYGLARENIGFAQAATEQLIGEQVLEEEDNVEEDGTLPQVAARLERAAAELTESPSVAAADLEAAWRLLAGATAPPEPR